MIGDKLYLGLSLIRTSCDSKAGKVNDLTCGASI